MKLRFSLFLMILLSSEFGYGQKISLKDTIYITQCDTGTQGKMVFDIERIKNQVSSNSSNAISPTIYLCTANGGIIKVVDILSNSSIQTICAISGKYWTDIAINKNKEIYLCEYHSIYKLDTSNCTTQLFYGFDANSFLVALSFDTKNNLYFSEGSIVYRFNNTSGAPVLWHDFGYGRASGDFVMKNGKMYIAWDNLNGVDLLEVTVDNNINYLSHKNLCSLKLKTYGLASELGQLYGVTPTELYKIDDKTCQYTTIKLNIGNPWYGAAGYHEAQNSVTAHLNFTDATTLSNILSGLWMNTTPYQQFIYVTVNDRIKDSLFIYPVKIKLIPRKTTTLTKTICKGQTYEGYSSTGSYNDIYKDAYGCDSVRTLSLTVADRVIDTLRASICQGEKYRTHNTTGIYYENYKTSYGCDSILVIDLKVRPISSLTLNKIICTGKSFAGKSVAGIYIDTFKNSAGCDSIRTLNLSVISIPKPIINKYTCIIPNQKFKFYSQTIVGPGIYIDSTNHIEECDTIYHLYVSPLFPSKDTFKSTQCQGYSFKGIILNRDTFIRDTLKSFLGCDSIYRLHDIHIQALTIPKPITVYYCDTFLFKKDIFQKDTSLIDTIRYAHAPFCDSMRQKLVYKKAPKPIVSIHTLGDNYCVKGETITLEAKGADKYVWNTSEMNSKLTIMPLITSIYIVKGWNEYNCVDSTQVEIEVEDFVHFDVPNAFSPNGDGNNDLWLPNADGKFEIERLDIFNRWGEKVFSGNQQAYAWNGYYNSVLQSEGVYAYYILVKKNRRLFEKIGSFTLVR